MISKITGSIGKMIFFAGWPFWFVYFRVTTRTRVLIIHENQLLVVKGRLGGQKWSLPGGGLHKDENPVVGAQREVQEETGIQLTSEQLRYLGPSSVTQHGITISYHCYAVKLKTKPQTTRQKIELSDIQWIQLDGLNDKNAEQDTLDVIEIWRSTSVSGTI